jgi:hypothetical protein
VLSDTIRVAFEPRATSPAVRSLRISVRIRAHPAAITTGVLSTRMAARGLRVSAGGQPVCAYLPGRSSGTSPTPPRPHRTITATCGRHRSKLEAMGASCNELNLRDADDLNGIEAFVKRAKLVVGLAVPFIEYSVDLR